MEIYKLVLTPRFKLPNGRFANGKAGTDGIVKFLFQAESDYPFSANSRWQWSCIPAVDLNGVTYDERNFGDTIFAGFNSKDMMLESETDKGIFDCFKVKGTFRNDGSVTVRAKREGFEIEHTLTMGQLLAAGNDDVALSMNYNEASITFEGDEPVEPDPVDPEPTPDEDVPDAPVPDDLWSRVKNWFEDLFDRYTTVTAAVAFIAGIIIGAWLW